MDFRSIYENAELLKLLDYYHPEVISYELQNSLFSETGVILTIKSQPQPLLKLLQDQLMFDFTMFKLERGLYRLLSYVPDFKNKATQILYFDDDIFELTNLKTRITYKQLGRQVLVQSQIKPQNVQEFIPEGDYLLKIKGDKYRQQFNDYLAKANTKEWEEKSHLWFNVKKIFLKHDPIKAKEVIQNRCSILQVKLPEINWDKVSQISSNNRADYFLTKYQIPNPKIIGSNNCLIVNHESNLFVQNITNQDYFKKQTSINSYLFHLNLMIRRLKYQYNKTNRLNKP